MSVNYQPVLWNKYKKQYDFILWVAILLYLMVFIGLTVYLYPSQNINTTLIRAFGTLAVILLHGILIIGPLSRISGRFLPILYNRRHLGVSMFLIAATHSFLSILQFHSNGNVNPLLSVFISNQHYGSLIFFPFQTLGFAALIILAAMAFTSHDFWLHFLSPKFWKIMHMMVYVAYGLIMLHIALGIIQFEKSPVLVAILFTGLIAVATLHLWAGFKENKADKINNPQDEDWNFVCNIADIEEDKAKIVNVQNERVAIFKYGGKLSAVHNVCKHQMGPLGEGKIIDGCITCPWHSYQYRPEDGCAPAPFTEKIATYQLKLLDDKIYVNPIALPEGTFVEPVVVPVAPSENTRSRFFFIGWAKNNKSLFGVARLSVFFAALLMVIIATALSSSQQKLSPFKIDYDNVKKIEGWLSARPFPTLKIIDGKDGYGNPVFKSILLMDAFKFGADAVVKKVLDGDSVKYVTLTGYLSSNVISCSDTSSQKCKEICNQCITGTTNNPVMEIENGRYSFETAKAPVVAKANITSFGIQTLHGEIIDPKCYFGAMNPGYGKPHISCAVRCISGGIMPVLKYELNNENRYAVLVGLNSEKINNDLLNFIGMPVEITGHLSKMDNWSVLQIDTKDIRYKNIKRFNRLVNK